MREWNEPVLDELNVSETMKGHHNLGGDLSLVAIIVLAVINVLVMILIQTIDLLVQILEKTHNKRNFLTEYV